MTTPHTNLSMSVVIITRNRYSSLRDTLQSLSVQTRPADEIIVVDNGSRDKTKQVCDEFSKTLPLVYLYEEEASIPKARNVGVGNAKNDILCFIDDDCIADTRWLEYMEAPFLKDNNLKCVGGEVTYHKQGKGAVEEFYISQLEGSI